MKIELEFQEDWGEPGYIRKGRHKRKMQIEKKFEDYELTVPKQLSLFQFLEDSAESLSPSVAAKMNRYSQSIELYDFMPKYVWGKCERDENGGLPILTRQFECRGIKRKLRLHPAGVVDEKTNESKYFYLGRREEIVEDVLRKLAIENGVFLDGKSGVTFTFHQIRNELKKHNHTLSYYEVLESLTILSLAKVELLNAKGKRELVFSPITLGLRGEGEETQTYIIFSPLVTEGIMNIKFRLYDYQKVMAYKSVIARQLHKRMSHFFKNAEISKTFDIYLTRIIQDFGLTTQKSLNKNLEKVKLAIQELEDSNVILNANYEEKIIDAKTQKLVDVFIKIRPTPQFTSEIKKANYFETRNLELIGEKESAQA